MWCFDKLILNCMCSFFPVPFPMSFIAHSSIPAPCSLRVLLQFHVLSITRLTSKFHVSLMSTFCRSSIFHHDSKFCLLSYWVPISMFCHSSKFCPFIVLSYTQLTLIPYSMSWSYYFIRFNQEKDVHRTLKKS